MKFVTYILFFCLSTQLYTQTFLNSKKENPEKNLKTDISKKKFDNYFFLALKYKALENYEESINAFQRCIDINNTHSFLFYELSKIYKIQERYFLSIKNIEQAISKEPGKYWYLIL